MTPEYLNQLADLADPDGLWRLSPFAQMDLPMDKRHQLDTGVALRRYAEHSANLRTILQCGRSLLITPISPNSAATSTIDTPAKHAKLRDRRPA